ncbi:MULTISPECIES: hypothetical protein [Microbacterium]|uniref:hypothetical protein n=1 Tax=Microbacterium TaxID=33882 RepID=UPI0027874D1E|nr:MULTISPECIES: hypothetical protein [Microbacterium]MDQ1084251.1 hypothetical protein [Microbacterium sp. SORGH_AS_0344]MDQ1170473.1 hypothetical protein [Microbacterium proteolyticum]
MVSPFLFFVDERLSLAELSAACLDGLLVPLGEGFIPADAVETPWMRARSLLPLLGERWAAVRRTAAWIHGAVDEEPFPHHVQRAGSTRVRARSDARVVFHDVRLEPADIRSLAGVHLSSPERTLADLARSGDEGEVALAREWARHDPQLGNAAASWLARHPRFPHARRAAAVLSAATVAAEAARHGGADGEREPEGGGIHEPTGVGPVRASTGMPAAGAVSTAL